MNKFTIFFLILIIGVFASVYFYYNYYDNNSSQDTSDNLNNVESEFLPLPPTITFSQTEHRKRPLKELFKNCNLSGEKRSLINACNYTNKVVRNNSVNLASQSEGAFNLGQICDIFDSYIEQWKYVNDPRCEEYIAFASETIQNGLTGDCDDFAVLICSSILAIGGEARINYAYSTQGGHAFTEVNLGNTGHQELENYIQKRYKIKEKIQYRRDKEENKWLNLDWFAKYPGGQYFPYNSGTTFYIIQKYCEDF